MNLITILAKLRTFRWTIAILALIALGQLWISNDTCSEWKHGGYYTCHYGLGAFGYIYLEVWACALPVIVSGIALVLVGASREPGWKQSLLSMCGRALLFLAMIFLVIITIGVVG